MNLLKELIQKIRVWKHNRKDPKKVFPASNHIITHAFSVAGTDYYQFNDVFNLPFERGLMALAIYEETRMSCSKEYLQKHVEVVREILHPNGRSIDIYKLNQLNEQLSERLSFSFDTNLLYKLASVVFFDKNENPSLYEPEYCNKKIEFWKKNKGITDFFLQKPIVELIPFLKNVEFDLEAYSIAIDQINKIHSERFQLSKSKK